MQDFAPSNNIQPSYADLSPLYVQIMITCQPFYGLPKQQHPHNGSSSSFTIPPRLEDGLITSSPLCIEVGQTGQENPQDC